MGTVQTILIWTDWGFYSIHDFVTHNVQARACGRGDEAGEGGDDEQDDQLAHRHARWVGSPVPPWVHG